METRQMFSLTTRIALPGKRDALAQILLKASRNVPGCLDYVVANDPSDESLVWIDEVWESEASRRSALSLAQVKEATRAALPMIAGVGDGRHERG
jgi:quinol monooxygenase YgiN